MHAIKKYFREYFWFFYKEEELFNGPGLYSNVKVTKRADRVNLFTGKENYLQTSINTDIDPYGSHFDWYLAAPWFSGNFDGTINSLLILGLGGGAQVKTYNKVYKVSRITAVEIDPLIIELGKKFFSLNDSNLNTINADSSEFINTDLTTYDQIILDSFKENLFDENCHSSPFLQKLSERLSKNGVLMVNKVNIDTGNTETGKMLKKYFKTVITLQIKYSLFFIATNSSSAPKTADNVLIILKDAIKTTNALNFFTKLRLKQINIL